MINSRKYTVISHEAMVLLVLKITYFHRKTESLTHRITLPRQSSVSLLLISGIIPCIVYFLLVSVVMC
jgi:hypothetical protein